MNNQKFLQNILKKELLYIKNQLAKKENLDFDLDCVPGGISLIDLDGTRMFVTHDQFCTFLEQINEVKDGEHYDHFIKSWKDDTEVQGFLEQFYYTELFRERFRNGIAKDSYISIFEFIDKPVEATEVPTFYEGMTEQEKAYMDQDTWQEVSKIIGQGLG